MKNIAFYIGLFVLMGCSKTKEGTSDKEMPSIVSITPNRGQVGEKVTIAGRHLGDDRSDLLVSFGNHPAVISSFSKDQIEVVLPENGGSSVVQVTVKVGKKETSGFPFFYEKSDSEQPLQVRSFDNNIGIDGDTVLIYGTGFDIDRNNLKVLFDTEETEILESRWTADVQPQPA